MKIAKADLVPTTANLREPTRTFAELTVACATSGASRSTPGRIGRPGSPRPTRLAVERAQLHVLPADPHVAALGEERLVNEDQTIRFGSVRYSTPPGHVGARVWCRVVGEELAIVAMTATPARWRSPGIGCPRRATRASWTRTIRIIRTATGCGSTRPRARTAAEAAFLASATARRHGWSRPPRRDEPGPGEDGPRGRVRRAASAAHRVEPGPRPGRGRRPVRRTPTSARSWTTSPGDGDPGDVVRADETHSAQPGTGAWEGSADDDHRHHHWTPHGPQTPQPTARHDRTPTAPALPAELETLLRRMRLPYLRAAAPDVLATANAQRWDPAEVLRVLVDEEVIGRDARHPPDATQKPRRSPPAKRSRTWRPDESSIPTTHPTGPVHPGMDRPGRESRRRRTLGHRQSPTSSKRSPRPRSTPTSESPGSPWKPSPPPIGRAKADGSIARTIARICRCDLIVVDDIGMLPAGQDAAEAFYRHHRRRLRTPIDRRDQQHPPIRLRHHHAQNIGHRDRRPAPAPRPPDHHPGRHPPTRPSHRRERGPSPDHQLDSTNGDHTDHPPGILLSASPDKPKPSDRTSSALARIC